MALDQRYMRTIVGVGPECLLKLKGAVECLAVGNSAAVKKFNVEHGAVPPLDTIHDELAMRLYPYLKDAYIGTARLAETATRYTRRFIPSTQPRADSVRSLQQLGEAALAVIPHIQEIKRPDRQPGEHSEMRDCITAVAHAYEALSIICAQALRDR